MSDNYILFVCQLGNFQSRSILVPYDKFLNVPERLNDYNILKEKSNKNVKIAIKEQEYIIDNLLIQNYTKQGNLLIQDQDQDQDQMRIKRICSDMQGYADGLDDDCYYHMYDKEWYDDSITNICRGFNDIKNYIFCRSLKTINEKKINIVDGFLVLETINGKINYPIFDTSEEMLLTLYGYNKTTLL